MNLREKVANFLLGVVSWVLPEDHKAIDEIYQVVFTLDDQSWPVRRDRTNRKTCDLGWYGLVMCAAADLEDASNCIQDKEAMASAIDGAKYYREEANRRVDHVA